MSKRVLQLLLFFSLVLTSKSFALKYYWVNGSGDWVQSTSHWATTSGGQVYYLSQPSINDTVIFDANSFTATGQVVTLDSTNTYYCHTMIWDAGVQFNPILVASFPHSTKLIIAGSLDIQSYVMYNMQVPISFEATTAGNIIRTSRVIMLYFDFNSATGGEWTLQDSLKTAYIDFYGGTLYTNNQFVRSSTAITSKTTSFYKEIHFGTSVVDAYNGIDFTEPIKVYADSAFFYIGGLKDLGKLGNSYNEINVNLPGSTAMLYTDSCLIKKVNSSSHTVWTTNPDVLIIGTENIYNHVDVLGSLLIGTAGSIFNYAKAGNDLVLDNKITFDTLYLDNAGYTVTFKADSIQTINGTVLTNPYSGCNVPINFKSNVTGVQASLYKSSDTVTCNSLSMQDIKAYGGAVFMANYSDTVSNVSGWTLTPPVSNTYYWIGGQGAWSDPAHWSLSSGGSAASCLPGQNDNVYFDANSFTGNNQRVILDKQLMACKDFSVTSLGYTGIKFIDSTFVLGGVNTGKFHVYGSFILTSTVTWANMRDVQLRSTSTNNIVNSVIKFSILSFVGSGTWDLLAALQAGTIYFDAGELNTNNFSITADFFNSQSGSNNNRKLNFGTSNINVMEYTSTPYTLLDADSAIFNTHRLLPGNTLHHRVNVTFNANSLWGPGIEQANGIFDTITSNCTFRMTSIPNLTVKYLKLDFPCTIITDTGHIERMYVAKDVFLHSDITIDTLELNNRGYEVSMGNGLTLTIDTILTTPGCANGFYYLDARDPTSWSAPGISYLKKTSGSLTINDFVLRNIFAIGGASFTANNSFALNNVQGFTLNSPIARTLYWVGGTGSWSNLNKWSLTSGGSGGQCIPTPADTVLFDNNSGLASATVTQNLPNAFCAKMAWNHTSLPKATFSGSSGAGLVINGDLLLDSMTNLSYSGLINMIGSGNHVINPCGTTLAGELKLDYSNSNYDLLGGLKTASATIYNGVFRTNDHGIVSTGLTRFYADSIYFGKSYVKAGNLASSAGWWKSDSASFDVGPNSNFQFRRMHYLKSDGGIGIIGCRIERADLGITGTTYVLNSTVDTIGYAVFNLSSQVLGNNVFGTAIFKNNATIVKGNQYDTLIFNNPGKTITLPSDSNNTQLVNNQLFFNSANNFITNIQSDVPGQQAYIKSLQDTVCADYLAIRDCNAGGGAVYYAGANGINNGNNTGWNFSACTAPPVSDVWPGDANSDKIVDMYDMLYVGLAFNEYGFVRPGGHNGYIQQPALDWNRVFLNQVNIKHADCNGNGVIDSLDLAAININYNLTHQRIINPLPENTGTSGIPNLYIIPNQSTYNAGDSVFLQIHLGNSNDVVSNLYGIAYSLTYENSFIQSGSVKMSYAANTWFTNVSNRVHLEKDFYTNSKIDLGLSRKNLTNVNGFGNIATFKCKLKPGVSGYLNFGFAGIKAISNNESQITVNSLIDSVLVQNGVGIGNYSSSSSLRVFPTLTQGKVTLAHAGEVKIARITVTDMNGRSVMEHSNIDKNDFTIDLGWLTPSVYFINCQTDTGLKVFKVVKM